MLKNLSSSQKSESPPPRKEREKGEANGDDCGVTAPNFTQPR
jgi:hypothetical protein